MTVGPHDTVPVEELARALRAHYGSRLVDLVLFGSRARGEPEAGSDYDLLVVLQGDVDPREERQKVGDIVYGVCWEHDVVITCHFIDADRYRREQSPFMLNLRREGVPV